MNSMSSMNTIQEKADALYDALQAARLRLDSLHGSDIRNREGWSWDSHREAYPHCPTCHVLDQMRRVSLDYMRPEISPNLVNDPAISDILRGS